MNKKMTDKKGIMADYKRIMADSKLLMKVLEKLMDSIENNGYLYSKVYHKHENIISTIVNIISGIVNIISANVILFVMNRITFKNHLKSYLMKSQKASFFWSCNGIDTIPSIPDDPEWCHQAIVMSKIDIQPLSSLLGNKKGSFSTIKIWCKYYFAVVFTFAEIIFTTIEIIFSCFR